MKVSVLVCSGDYTETINGVVRTGSRTELIKASTNYDKLVAELETGKVDVADVTGWGVRAISVYQVEVEGL